MKRALALSTFLLLGINTAVRADACDELKPAKEKKQAGLQDDCAASPQEESSDGEVEYE